MAKSKNRPKHKAVKKQRNIQKQKIREMINQAENQPVTFVYHKDKKTVEVPINLWQTLNQAASQLQAIAMIVSIMETVGQQHMQDGTLLPVFKDDVEPTGKTNPDGSPNVKIKDSFWIRGKDTQPVKVPKTTDDVVKETVTVPEKAEKEDWPA